MNINLVEQFLPFLLSDEVQKCSKLSVETTHHFITAQTTMNMLCCNKITKFLCSMRRGEEWTSAIHKLKTIQRQKVFFCCATNALIKVNSTLWSHYISLSTWKLMAFFLSYEFSFTITCINHISNKGVK